MPHSPDKLKCIEVDPSKFYARKHVSRDCNNETNKRTSKQTTAPKKRIMWFCTSSVFTLHLYDIKQHLFSTHVFRSKYAQYNLSFRPKRSTAARVLKSQTTPLWNNSNNETFVMLFPSSKAVSSFNRDSRAEKCDVTCTIFLTFLSIARNFTQSFILSNSCHLL